MVRSENGLMNESMGHNSNPCIRVVQAYTDLPPELRGCKDSVDRWCALRGYHVDMVRLEMPFGITHPGIASDFVRVKELTVPYTLWLDWDVYVRSLPPLEPKRPFRAGEWIIWNGEFTSIFEVALRSYIEHIRRFPNAKSERFRMVKCLKESGFYSLPEISRSVNNHLFRGSQR